MGGDHHDFTPAAMPRDDQDLELLKREKIPLSGRNKCAHLLVPLNRCRRATWHSPTKCIDERHLYDECMYISWTRRVEAKTKMKAEQAAAAAAEAELAK